MQGSFLRCIVLFGRFSRVFTGSPKNGNLGIILLMDQQFKNILQKTKAIFNGSDPIAHTYEGALFKDSAWVFGFDETVQVGDQVVENHLKLEKTEPVALTQYKSLVMFVGDSFLEENSTKGEEDLLGKMIAAMKLKNHEFCRIPFNRKLEDVMDLDENLKNPTPETQALFSAIAENKPMIVVSLGAIVTNILLGKRDKLSGIHGQFFEKSIVHEHESHNYQLLPIFHPEFLIINPNMKRTAWIDLQKVMERVGKN